MAERRRLAASAPDLAPRSKLSAAERFGERLIPSPGCHEVLPVQRAGNQHIVAQALRRHDRVGADLDRLMERALAAERRAERRQRVGPAPRIIRPEGLHRLACPWHRPARVALVGRHVRRHHQRPGPPLGGRGEVGDREQSVEVGDRASFAPPGIPVRPQGDREIHRHRPVMIGSPCQRRLKVRLLGFETILPRPFVPPIDVAARLLCQPAEVQRVGTPRRLGRAGLSQPIQREQGEGSRVAGTSTPAAGRRHAAGVNGRPGS